MTYLVARKSLLMVAGSMAVLGLLGLFLPWEFRNPNANAQRYQIAEVVRGPITRTVLASGRLRAVVTVDIGTQVSGMIKSLAADFNSQVSAGEVIARIDSAPFEARLTQAEAELAVAQAQVSMQKAMLEELEAKLSGDRARLTEAQKELDRKRKLRVQGGIPESAVDTALSNREQSSANVNAGLAQLNRQRAQIELARAQVLQKASVVKQRQLDLEYTYIRSSVDGIVISRNVETGQTVAASLQTPVLFRIAQDLARLEVYISVDEADIGVVQVGNKVLFTVDSFPGKTFAGDVHQIRKISEEISNVVTYTVIATADNPDLTLLPGMTANVNIVVGERDAVLKVPATALYFQPPDEPAYGRDWGRRIWLLEENGRLRQLAVTPGMSNGTETEISGADLVAGQQVIVGFASPDAG
jgi:HlyD family secretion protein